MRSGEKMTQNPIWAPALRLADEWAISRSAGGGKPKDRSVDDSVPSAGRQRELQ